MGGRNRSASHGEATSGVSGASRRGPFTREQLSRLRRDARWLTWSLAAVAVVAALSTLQGQPLVYTEVHVRCLPGSSPPAPPPAPDLGDIVRLALAAPTHFLVVFVIIKMLVVYKPQGDVASRVVRVVSLSCFAIAAVVMTLGGVLALNRDDVACIRPLPEPSWIEALGAALMLALPSAFFLSLCFLGRVTQLFHSRRAWLAYSIAPIFSLYLVYTSIPDLERRLAAGSYLLVAIIHAVAVPFVLRGITKTVEASE